MPVKRAAASPSIEVVYHTPPDRLNEDAWLAMQAGSLGEQIIFAAIDGATTRLTPPPLQRYLDAQPVKLTPAAYSARVLRDSLTRQIAEGGFPNLRALLLEANTDLGRALTTLFGSLTLDGMAFPEEVYATLAHDPRRVRLGLPASVITLAEYDPATRDLHYAHVGDTSLLVAYQDGRVAVPTRTGGDNFDSDVKHTALKLREYHPGLTFRELTQRPEIQQHNLDSGIRHNYVDEHGLPQPAQGVGAVNGQPELRYFVQTGKLSMDEAAFVCAMTDGLEWPASAREVFAKNADESAALREERYLFMAEQIAELGLWGYLNLLRQHEAADPDFEQYPRLKAHDDATGVLLRFEDVYIPEPDEGEPEPESER